MRWWIILAAALASACGPADSYVSDESAVNANGLLGEYFDDTSLSERRLTRVDGSIDFAWGDGPPAPGIDRESFSVRWTGTLRPRFSQLYTFRTRADDGVRLWVDGALIIDDWNEHGTEERSGNIALVAEVPVAIRLEYFDARWSSEVHLSWSSASQPMQIVPPERMSPDASLRGEYYDDADLRTLRIVRPEPAIDFRFGQGSPAPAVGADSFSARWTGFLTAEVSELHTLIVESDDGVRLWLDDRLLIDHWNDHGPAEDRATVSLVAGERHHLRMEYYEAQLGALVRLSWSSPSRPRRVIPASAFSAPPSIAGPFGLDARPAGCTAPSRPATGAELVPAFPNLTFSAPLAMVRRPGDRSRWYVLEKDGRVLRFANRSDVASAPAVVDLSSLVRSEPSEGGLLGMAFDPDFSANGDVFLSYTADGAASPVGLRSVLARFHSGDGGDTIDPSASELLSVNQPFENHNGGHAAFGPDGLLYLALGDGGSAGDPGDRAQNRNSLFGKILRIGVNGGAPYSIPSANPFAGGGGRAEIFALGFRNPWRFSFDRSTGELWAGDVGQDRFEEIDVVVAGGNYGWKIKEGEACFGRDPCDAPDLVEPVHVYGRSDGVSITGGFVYRGARFPSLAGAYVYGDFGSGTVWALFPDTGSGRRRNEVLVQSNANIASFAEDEDGELFVVDFASGRILSLVPRSNPSSGGPAALLSQTGCNDQSRTIPYDVTAALWSDGAAKERSISIPAGARAHVRSDGSWELPRGTVLVKSFSLFGTRVETRLLVRHQDGGWAGYSYRWRADGSDAELLSNSATRTVNGQTWTFPSRAQCLQCHTQAADFVLGFEPAQLNRSLQYPSGVNASQLATLDHLGVLDAALWHAPSESPRLDDPARAYLQANCAHCHQPSGPGGGGLDFRYSTPLAAMGACDVPPSTTDFGIAGARILAPGAPSRSMISVRTHRADGGRMPPLATSLIDASGTQLIDAWIGSIAGCP